MKHHRGSVLPEEGVLGDFAPKGDKPTMLGRGSGKDGAGKGQGSVSDAEASAALSEFSALKTGLSYSSLEAKEGISVPLEDIATSLTNRKV